MAGTESEKSSSFLGDLKGLALSFGEAKLNNLVTDQSEKNVPDMADIKTPDVNPDATARDISGGQLNGMVLGMTQQQILIGSAVVLGLALVLKQVVK